MVRRQIHNEENTREPLIRLIQLHTTQTTTFKQTHTLVFQNTSQKVKEADTERQYMEHILTPELDTIIINMLYSEIRTAMLAYYGKDGKYDAKFLAEEVSNRYERDKLRNWLRKETPDWMFGKRDTKNNSKIWALRHELEYLQLFAIHNFVLKDWVKYNIHNVFHDSAYIDGVAKYKSDRDDDILVYRLSN